MKIGCCGFPKGKEKYFRTFKLVEVQQTFYEPTSLDTLKKWREKAPEDFEFTIKAWQVITHPPSSPTYRRAKTKPEKCGFFQPVPDVFQAWERIKECAEALGANIILFQPPASFKPTDENKKNMVEFFSNIERGGFNLLWEPRGAWKREEIEEMLDKCSLSHVVDPFKDKRIKGEIPYYRLHGKGGYRYRYTDEELKELKGMLEPDAYVLFNNTNMWEDAIRFMEILK
ncbi:DUF72 domain-containing protein [bacterium]|nr:MAG: DUF72 domain-containing protein [bacterium]